MVRTCRAAKAVGLAAPQVGILERLIVTCAGYPCVWVNPIILEKSEVTLEGPEGCLSVPRKVVMVRRAKHITLSWQDLDGNSNLSYIDGLLAVVLQHEIDHLDGILITDYEEKNAETSTS